MKDYYLKPCPFCRYRAELVNTRDDAQAVDYQVVCQSCGSSGPRGNEELPAVVGWNRRTIIPAEIPE